MREPLFPTLPLLQGTGLPPGALVPRICPSGRRGRSSPMAPGLSIAALWAAASAVASAEVARKALLSNHLAQGPPAPVLPPGILPNGTIVAVNGAPHKVVHLPTMEPTLSPDRGQNYNVQMSPEEYMIRFYGTTPPPPHDCVRSPGTSDCTCEDILESCSEESYQCEGALRELSKEEPRSVRNNYLSKFNHPLLNTLALRSRRSRLLRRSRAQPCLQCFKRLAQDAASTRSDPQSQWSFLQHDTKKGPTGRGYEPATWGWRIDQDAPVTFNFGYSEEDVARLTRQATVGHCSAEEIEAMEECLTYFWSCDRNRVYLQQHIHELDGDTEWIDTHPGARPGVFAGSE